MTEMKEGMYQIGLALKKNGNSYEVKLKDFGYQGEPEVTNEFFNRADKPVIAAFNNDNGTWSTVTNDNAITESINSFKSGGAIHGGARATNRRKSQKRKQSKSMKRKLRRYK